MPADVLILADLIPELAADGLSVGGGKVFVFETIKGRWGGDAAAEMYKNVIAKALKKKYPGKKSYRILEERAFS